jgi:CHAT domain-containing protein/cytochrome c-type biogenesis protein CcmH/NrfG
VGCPPEADWALLAVGLVDTTRKDVLLDHASHCDACGRVLRAIVEDSSEEMYSEESRAIEMLKSSRAGWRRNMARRRTEASPPGRRLTLGIRTHPAAWLVRAAVLVMTVGAAWLGWNRWIAGEPVHLIAKAYAQRRPFDWRLPQAAYGPVRRERGATPSLQKPTALLEAEFKIKRELEKQPDDVQWLDLKAQTEMLESDPEAAISTLQHALERKPDNPGLLGALGVAYALRAETQNRDVDYGFAIENLRRSLKAKPDAPAAVFNLAIVYERMYLYPDAIDQWRNYLDLDKSGDWDKEAQRRLAELEQKKKVRAEALATLSDKHPEGLLRRIDEGKPVEPEQYLDLAVIEWLPRQRDSEKFASALSALGSRFEERHGDRWLHDALALGPSHRRAAGLTALSEAVEANLTDATDQALERSREAIAFLQSAGDSAGAARAELEEVYALQRAVRPAECLQKVVAVERQAAGLHYSWILGQALLDQGNCQALQGDFGAAYNSMFRALSLARDVGYHDLELRAAGIMCNAQTESGDLLAAWKLATAALANYWSGVYSGIRAHQIYYNLGRSAESLNLHQTAYVLSRAAAMAIAETPRRLNEAHMRAHVARLAAEAGWPNEAKTEFDHAERLFDRLEQTTANKQFRILAELYRAESEVAGGEPEAALQRLETIRIPAEHVDAAQDQIMFQQTRGDALWHSGRRGDAEAPYRHAVNLSEVQLKTLRGFRERTGLMLVAGKAYRGLTEVLWDGEDPAGALRFWEWFRSGEQPARLNDPDLDQRRTWLQKESFLAYAVLPGGVVAWVFDDRGVKGHRLGVKPEELEVVASRFLRECADPASDVQAVKRDARQLYDWLVAPVAQDLDPARTLVVEPDGALAGIPMQALMDENQRFLGDRFAITVAGGLADYQRRAGSKALNSSAKALIVADPSLAKETALAFPPLVQAAREGASLAARFRNPILLSGEKATLAAIEAHRPDADLFHFAGHGFSNAGNGGLLLSPGANTEVAVLDGTSMAQQDWSRCRLAVLSACSTGTGEARGPVNPESLVRGLLWAGVGRVVATRWNMDSESGEKFIGRFYTELLSGEDVARAIQKAGTALRGDAATSHPYFWAGFQNFGTR